MDTIEQFLLSHKLISCNSLEKLIDAPTGTIRLDGSRGIPMKYKQAIIDIICKYGYKPDDVLEEPVQAIAEVMPNNNMYEFTYYRDMIRYVNEAGTNNSTRPEGIHIYIRCDDIELKDGYKGPFVR